MKNRIKELDYLKSIFIILMVIFHLVYIGDKYPYLKQIVYTFHMPAFLVISGYLTNIRQSAFHFLQTMCWIFIPYAIMETGYVAMSSLLSVREKVNEITLPVIFHKVFVAPIGPYWYLHTLVICSTVYYTVSKVCYKLKGLSMLIIVGSILAILSYKLQILSFSNALYFILGATVYQSKLNFTLIFQPSALAILPLIVLCTFSSNLDRSTLAGVAITCFVMSFFIWIYAYLSENIKRLSHFIGENTLPILLFSPIFTLLSKTFIPLFSFDNSGLCFMFTAVLFTVTGCFAIAWTMDKMHLSPYFCGKTKLLRR